MKKLIEIDPSGRFVKQVKPLPIDPRTGKPFERPNTIEADPPKIKEGKYAVWNDKKWVYNDIPKREITDEERIWQFKKQIEEIKEKLKTTDYIATKIAEGAATVEEYKDQIAARQGLREEINKIQEQIAELEKNLKS